MKAEEIIPMSHRLEQSGMSRSEAEAVVIEFERVVAPLATKDDLAAFEKSIRDDMKSMEKSIRGDMKSMEESIRGDMKSLKESIQGDMKSLKESTGSDMKSLKETLTSDMAKMESRLLWRLSGVMLGYGALLLAIAQFLQ